MKDYVRTVINPSEKTNVNIRPTAAVEKQVKCTYCKQAGHYQTFCRQKPNKPIQKNAKGGILPLHKRVGKIQAENMLIRQKWIQKNPPDYRGYWACYLQIHPLCPKLLDIYMMTLEHVIPKSKGEEHRRDLQNILPSCSFCNGLKGSRSIENLAKDFPNIDVSDIMRRIKGD